MFPYWSVDLGKKESVVTVTITQCLDDVPGNQGTEDKQESNPSLIVVVTNLTDPPKKGTDLEGNDYKVCGKTTENKDGVAETIKCPKGTDGSNVYVYLPEKGVLAVSKVVVTIDDEGINALRHDYYVYVVMYSIFQMSNLVISLIFGLSFIRSNQSNNTRRTNRRKQN